MIYILGGAARSGKSIIARKILKEKNIPYFALDYLKMGLYHGLPSVFIDNPDNTSEKIAEKLWPILKTMIINMIEVKEDYVLEGDCILPHQINELLAVEKYQDFLRICFVGYKNITAEEKFEIIRSTHGTSLNDWIKGKTDDFILNFSSEKIERSHQLEKECNNFGIKYIDISTNFESKLEEVVEYLTLK